VNSSDPVAGILDPLTHLPARAGVMAELNRRLSRSRNRQPTALAMVDFASIQGFVQRGMPGDTQLIVKLGRLLRAWVPAEYLVGHLREREFAILLAGAAVTEAENLATAIVENMRKEESLEGRQRYIVTTIGIGYSTKSDCKSSELMSLADIALHYAWATGRSCHVIVDRVPASQAA